MVLTLIIEIESGRFFQIENYGLIKKYTMNLLQIVAAIKGVRLSSDFRPYLRHIIWKIFFRKYSRVAILTNLNYREILTDSKNPW